MLLPQCISSWSQYHLQLDHFADSAGSMRETCCLIHWLLSHWTWTKPFSLFPIPSGIGHKQSLICLLLFSPWQMKSDFIAQPNSARPHLFLQTGERETERSRGGERSRRSMGRAKTWLNGETGSYIKRDRCRERRWEVWWGKHRDKYGSREITVTRSNEMGKHGECARWRGGVLFQRLRVKERHDCITIPFKQKHFFFTIFQRQPVDSEDSESHPTPSEFITQFFGSVLPALTQISPSLQQQEKMTGATTSADSFSCFGLFQYPLQMLL